MNPSIFITSWTTLWYLHHLAATEISTKKNLTDYKYPALILNLPDELYGTACPASTEREIKFNDEISISGKGLFLRDIYHKNEIIVSSVCDKPVEPVMLYNLQTRTYDIGFELYYQQGKIQLAGSIYSRFRPRYDGGIIWHIDNITFGVSDLLEEPINKRNMYFSDVEHRRRIPIPKIIYRMIEGIQNRGVFNAIIVIHNDPTNVSDSDKICAKEDEVPGWENIKNDDPRTGLTYVCYYHLRKISPSDKLKLNSQDLLSKPLRLDEVPRFMLMDSRGDVEFWDTDIEDTIENIIQAIEKKPF